MWSGSQRLPRQTDGVGLFGSKRAKGQEWRNRSAELADAGAFPWQVLWEALAVPVADPNGGAMAPPGLRGLHVGGRGDPTSTYHGERHGRWVQIRQDDRGHGRMEMIVWVGAAPAPFAVVTAQGRLVGQNAPSLIAMQSPSRVWNDMDCRAGSFGIIVRRIVTATQPQGWMYDLWLAEALAQVTGAAPIPPLPGDPALWTVPA